MKFRLRLLMWLICNLAILSLAQQPQGDFVQGRLFVKVKNDAKIILPEIRQEQDLILLEKQGLNPLKQLFESYEVYHVERFFKDLGNEDLDNTYVVRFKQMGFELELADKIMGEAWIDYAETEPIYYPLLTPNDFTASDQWYLSRINAEAAWDLTTGNPDVTIGIVDAGFLTTHPDLAPNIWTNPNEIPNNQFDDDGNGYVDDSNGWDAGNQDTDPNPPSAWAFYFEHGTSVSGAAAPATDNNIGIAGIGFDCSIIPVKAKSDGSAANTNQTFEQRSALDATTAGVTYAIRAGADVINMSYGGNNFSQTVQNLMTAAHDANIVLVGGAGNDNNSQNFYPAAYQHVISVASTNTSERKASFSNFGTTIDISAPGTRIRSLSHDGNRNPSYGNTQGTSLSSPIIAGLVGLMKSLNPCLTADQIEQFIKATAVNIDAQNSNFRGLLGAGRVDAAAALQAVNPFIAPLAKFSYDTISSCNSTVEFFYEGAFTGCPEEIEWRFNGQTSTVENPIFSVSDTGSYMVHLRVSNKLGSNEDSALIRIDHVLKLDAGGDQNGVLTACVGETVTLNSSSSVSNANFSWSPAIGISSTSILSPQVGIISNRTYTLTAVDSTGCETVDEVEIIVVNSVDAGEDEEIMLGDSVQLAASVVASGYNFEWTPTTGLSNPFIQSPKASPDRNTTYRVTATTISGCKLTDEVEVKVLNGLSIADGLGQQATVFALYPNPAKNSVTLSASFQEASELSITAYDMLGREVAQLYTGKVPQGDFSMVWEKDFSLHAGNYIIRWQTEKGQYAQQVLWK